MAETVSATTTSTAHSASPHHNKTKRADDPFDHIPQLTPSPEPKEHRDGKEHSEDEGSPDTLFNKVIMGPLIFTSFLVSLLIVDRRDRAWRMRQHPASSLWARFSNWIDPEPYQDPNDTTWQKDEGDNSTRNPVTDGNPGHKPQKQGWFRQKKHRKMAKYEFEDAFALRESVAAYLFGAGLLVVGGSAYAVKTVFGWRFW